MIPDFVNSVARSPALALSELTRRMDTTSDGLLSIHVLISISHSLNKPASRRSHEVWQRCQAPFDLWTWAVNIRTPALSCIVVLK